MNRRKAGWIIFLSGLFRFFLGGVGLWRFGVVGGERPAGCARDAGRVPLSSRATAKGGQPMTQLAALRQVSSVVQRSHPRAKRNQLPGSRHSRPDARRWHCWEWDARRRHRWEWDARRRHRWEWDARRWHCWEWDARRRHCWEWDARRRHCCFLREIDVLGERNVEKVTMLRVQHHGGVEYAVFP